MRALWVLTCVLMRRNRVMLLTWSICLVGLVAVTVPSYAATYPSLADRAPLVAEMRATVATKVLYGPLPAPGTLGQLAQWETGTYVTILVAVLAILLGVRLGRGEEHSGTTEVVRAAGAGRHAALTAAILVLTIAYLAIGGVTGAVLAWQSRTTAEVAVPGAWHFAAVVTLVGLGFGMSTLCLGQVLATPSAARGAAWLLLAAAFVVRVVADFAPAPELRWLTWLGLRDLVAPFTHDRTTPLAVAGATIVVLGAVAVWLDSRRELGAGLVEARWPSSRKVTVRSPLALAWRLERLGYLGWAAATVAIAALFGGMSHSLIALTARDASTSGMIGALTGLSDPIRQYFGLSVIFIALIPLVHAVARVLAARSAEVSGLLDAAVATGVQRWRPLAAQAVLVAAQSSGLLLLGGLVQAGVTAAVDGQGDASRWALWTVAVRIPGILAAVGFTTLLVGVAPRLSRAAWLLVAWSAFATLLGGLVRLPDWERRSSLLALEVHSVSSPLPELARPSTIGLLLILGLASAAAGVANMRRRDVQTGR